MSSTTIPTPSRLEKARNRLENAVSKVEAALDERKASPAVDSGTEKALTATRFENETLRETDGVALRRLDGIIDRLKVVLEE